MPIRQITVCISIFLVILLTGYWLNYQSNQPVLTDQLKVNWKNDVILSVDDLRVNATTTSFFPREYVRILPKIDDFSDNSPILPNH